MKIRSRQPRQQRHGTHRAYDAEELPCALRSLCDPRLLSSPNRARRTTSHARAYAVHLILKRSVGIRKRLFTASRSIHARTNAKVQRILRTTRQSRLSAFHPHLQICLQAGCGGRACDRHRAHAKVRCLRRPLWCRFDFYRTSPGRRSEATIERRAPSRP